MPVVRKIGLCLLAIVVLCAVCGLTADTADEQRARQLLQKQNSGQPLTIEERKFLKQMQQQLKRGGADPSNRKAGVRPSASQKVGGANYYVAATGKDTNTGAADSPWATIAHALAQLLPGDTLNLRAGTYYEHGLATAIQGTADHPITIQGYPGEQAAIDGGVPYYAELNRGEWVVCNRAIDEYRSARTFSGNYVRVWLIDARMQIFQYKKQADMESTNYGPVNGSTPMYFGPGAQLRSDGHLYIRLSPNPNDQYDAGKHAIAAAPSDVNPNHNRMAVSVTESIGRNVIFDDVLQYVAFQNMTVAHAKTLFDIRPGSDHVAFKDSTFLYGTYGINIRTDVSDVEIAHNTFDNQVPYFLYWTDVKNNAREVAEGYPDFQSIAAVGLPTNTSLHDNIIQNGFDGMGAADGANISVKNNQFLNLHDDAMNFMTGSSGEVAHNLMWHVDSGIAILGSGGSAGDLFIHHNVIDTSALRHGGRAGNYRASVWPEWNTDTPFANHGGGDKSAWWKLYNNTIIARKVAYGTPMNPFSLTSNSHYYAVNNIFYAVDDRLVCRGHLTASGGKYDGNILWRGASGSPLFQSFGDGGTYDTLAAFQAKQTSWEAHGQQVDPGFDLAEIGNPDYSYPTVLTRYQPRNPAVGTAGFSYRDVTWPETSGVNYAGAFPPNGRPRRTR